MVGISVIRLPFTCTTFTHTDPQEDRTMLFTISVINELTTSSTEGVSLVIYSL